MCANYLLVMQYAMYDKNGPETIFPHVFYFFFIDNNIVQKKFPSLFNLILRTEDTGDKLIK